MRQRDVLIPAELAKLNPPLGDLIFYLFLEILLSTYFCEELIGLSFRCAQPAQQQGRRFPFLNSSGTLFTCSFLVSAVLTEIVQQIHSLRASGVMSSHAKSTFEEEVSAFRKSSGTVCAVPLEIIFLDIYPW